MISEMGVPELDMLWELLGWGEHVPLLEFCQEIMFSRSHRLWTVLRPEILFEKYDQAVADIVDRMIEDGARSLPEMRDFPKAEAESYEDILILSRQLWANHRDSKYAREAQRFLRVMENVVCEDLLWDRPQEWCWPYWDIVQRLVEDAYREQMGIVICVRGEIEKDMLRVTWLEQLPHLIQKPAVMVPLSRLPAEVRKALKKGSCFSLSVLATNPQTLDPEKISFDHKTWVLLHRSPKLG